MSATAIRYTREGRRALRDNSNFKSEHRTNTPTNLAVPVYTGHSCVHCGQAVREAKQAAS